MDGPTPSSHASATVKPTNTNTMSSDAATTTKCSNRDMAWEWGELRDPLKKQNVWCTLCGKKVSGGITKLKQHLTNSGGKVTGCLKVTVDIQKRVMASIKEKENVQLQKKRKKQILRPNSVDLSGEDGGVEDIQGDDLQEIVSKKSNRGKRGVATFSKKDCDWTIEFDEDMQPIGKNANNFTTWLGIKLKTEFPYHIASTKFEKEKWENLWLDIKEQWHIEGEASKYVMIKKAKKQHTNWRSFLTTDYVRNEITPFKKYKYLDPDQWEAFVAERTSKDFLIKSNKAKESASKNLIPTRLGRLGFAQLNPKLELIWSQLVAIYTFLEDIQDERSKRWIVSRAKKNKENNTYELVEEAHADSIKLANFEKEMIRDGSYRSGKEDPLTRLLGPEHGGRSRTTSHIIGRTQVHGGLFQGGKTHLPSSQPRSCTGLDSNPDSVGSSDASNRSHIDYPHIKEPTFCELLFPYLSKKERIIGTGYLYHTTSRILHGKQMEEGYVKVQIDDILPEYKVVPLPVVSCTDDIEEMGEAIGCFIQWPLFAVKFSKTQATHQNEPLRLEPTSTR